MRIKITDAFGIKTMVGGILNLHVKCQKVFALF